MVFCVTLKNSLIPEIKPDVHLEGYLKFLRAPADCIFLKFSMSLKASVSARKELTFPALEQGNA